jgi:hypothetical protein
MGPAVRTANSYSLIEFSFCVSSANCPQEIRKLFFCVMEKDCHRHVVWCLDGKNYASWKFGMKLALQSDELWEVVDGTQRQPDVVSLLMIY